MFVVFLAIVNKTVHALEEFQVGGTFAFERAVAAARVGDILVGKPVAHPVRNA